VGRDTGLLQSDGAKGHGSAGRGWHDVLVSVALLFAVLDLIVGGYLLWYARSRQRRDRESVAVVGVLLLVVAGCLTVATRRRTVQSWCTTTTPARPRA
jgi:hypothetical protein